MIDIHTHLCLGKDDIPKYCFGPLTPLFAKNDFRAAFVAKWLHWAIPFSSKDGLDRLAKVLTANRLTSEERVKKHLEHVDNCIVLCVDLQQMGAGECNRDYRKQLNEALSLKKKYGIKVGMMVDRLRPEIKNLVYNYQSAIDVWKYYPSISGTVNNNVIFWLLTNYPKPIFIHSTKTSPIYNHDYDKKEAGEWCNPRYAENFIRIFKNVPFILCHLGGKEWSDEVIRICKKYPNAYTDISYTYAEQPELIDKAFKEIPDKMLWGTDNYMIEPDEFFKCKYKEILNENNKKLFSDASR